MRFNYSSSSVCFSLCWRNPKKFLSPLFGLSPNQKPPFCSLESIFLYPRLHPDFFLFCLFSNEHRGVFEAFERRRKVKSRDTLSRTFPKSSFTHTNIHLHFNINNNVCCYSTNRVRRRPQGHQGSSTCLFLSFSFRDPIRSDRARASSSSWNYLFAYPTLYTIRENKMQNDTLSLSLSDPKPSSLLRSRRTKTVKGARRLCSLRVGIVLFLDPSAREEARALEREIGRKVLTLWASPRENLSFFFDLQRVALGLLTDFFFLLSLFTLQTVQVRLQGCQG